MFIRKVTVGATDIQPPLPFCSRRFPGLFLQHHAEQSVHEAVAAGLAGHCNVRHDTHVVLAGIGDVISVESLQLVIPHLADPAVVEEAGAVAVKIAGKLDAKHAAQIGLALNEVLKSARSPKFSIRRASEWSGSNCQFNNPRSSRIG